jgi:hypothetical protein
MGVAPNRGDIMNARVISIAAVLFSLCVAAGGFSYANLSGDQAASSLFDAVLATATLIIGGLITAAAIGFEHHAQRKQAMQAEAEAARKTSRRLTWALRRIAVEIIDAKDNVEALLEDTGVWTLTTLDDDTWRTSRNFVAQHMACGVAHYALNDCYTALRVMQIADRARHDYVLTAEDPTEARHIVEKHAKDFLRAANRTLELLAAYNPQVADKITLRTERGPYFAFEAHDEAMQQAASEAA